MIAFVGRPSPPLVLLKGVLALSLGDEFERLLSLAKRGDDDAVQSLLEPHLGGLHGFVRLRARGITGPRESHADLVQSICCQAIISLPELQAKTETGLKQWLYAIAMNKILDRVDYHRAEKRDPRREVAARFDSSVGQDQILAAYFDDQTPSRDAMTGEAVNRFEEAFLSLPPDQREVFIQSRLVGLSYAEIAEKMGKSEPSVRKTLSRARARLAMLLVPDDDL